VTFDLIHLCDTSPS